MNYASIFFILGRILQIEAGLLMLPTVVSMAYREKEYLSFFVVALACFAIGTLFTIKKPKNQIYYAREGFVTVALGWILMSAMGALPFVINGDIPSFTDAFFETISGFTTTGSSILNDVEALSKGSLFWRSFTHWVGGMGVFVFMLEILPMTGAQNMHLMRTESPGPEVGKLVPRLRDSAKILYILYVALSLIMVVLLAISGMPLFDNFTIMFGTAGTGGFAVKNSSCAGYTEVQRNITAIFMILFGVNFNFYYFLTFGKSIKEALKMEEVRTYIGIILSSIVVIMLNARGCFTSVKDAFEHALFQVASIITTTGYATCDFDKWPVMSKTVLLMLMLIGACAGSTGGGFKVSRLIVMMKTYRSELAHFIHPRLVRNIHMDGKIVKSETVNGIKVYLITYVIVFLSSFFLISIDNFDVETNFSAVAATFNNIGPGLAKVGPTCNFSEYSVFSKYVLMFDMLAGRLELYPMLLLFAPSTWRNR